MQYTRTVHISHYVQNHTKCTAGSRFCLLYQVAGNRSTRVSPPNRARLQRYSAEPINEHGKDGFGGLVYWYACKSRPERLYLHYESTGLCYYCPRRKRKTDCARCFPSRSLEFLAPVLQPGSVRSLSSGLAESPRLAVSPSPSPQPCRKYQIHKRPRPPRIGQQSRRLLRRASGGKAFRSTLTDVIGLGLSRSTDRLAQLSLQSDCCS